VGVIGGWGIDMATNKVADAVVDEKVVGCCVGDSTAM